MNKPKKNILEIIEEQADNMNKMRSMPKPDYFYISPPPDDWEGTMDEWAKKCIEELRFSTQ